MYHRLAILPLVLLLLLCASAQRQAPGYGTSPTFSTYSELQVRILDPDDRPVRRELRVQLLSGANSASLEEKFTNDGYAFFSAVPPGVYRLKVIGEGIDETVTNTFIVQRRENSHLESVQVRWRSDLSGPAPPSAPISVADLNVPQKARKEFKKGRGALADNDWKKAIEHFGKAVSLYPQYAAAYNSLGVAWSRSGNIVQARQAFEKAISTDDHLAAAYVNLSRISLKEHKYGEAETLLSRSLATEPMNLEALTLLAGAQLMDGHYDDAVASTRKVHSVPHQPFTIVHYLAARALESEHRNQEAAAEYRLFLQETPDSPQAQRAREALARLGQQKN